MEKTIVEVGLLLDKDIEFYNDMMVKAGGVNQFNCETHDMYWTNKTYEELSQMTENQIKRSCVRLRMVNGFGGQCFNGDFSMGISLDNFKIFDSKKEDRFKVTMDEFKKIQTKMESKGWFMIFDTFKVDYQYSIGDMKSRIQFQEIDRIGLLLYYDNPDYYDFTPERQRDALLDELNSYGFNFSTDQKIIEEMIKLKKEIDKYIANNN